MQATPDHMGTTMELGTLNSPSPPSPTPADYNWITIGANQPSDTLTLPLGASKFRLKATSENGASVCNYMIELTRPRSTDASIGSLTARICGRDCSAQQLGPEQSLTPSAYGTAHGRSLRLLSSCSVSGACYSLVLESSETTFLLTVISNHSFLCDSASHAVRTLPLQHFATPTLCHPKH